MAVFPWRLALPFAALPSAALPFAAHALAGPPSMASDLTVLLHNDLYANLSTRHPAVILLSAPQTCEDARSHCAELGEKVWAPDAASDIPLPHLGHADHYWTAGIAGRGCKAMDKAGLLSAIDCREKLPVLCTQSAPLSTADTADVSLKWQTDIMTGDQVVTGYRDRLSFRFEGLRYAPEPTRFTYSTLYNGTGDVSALAPGPQCIQSGCTASTCNEDCLFLNVWTPYLPATPPPKRKLKPVMFWIHGGAFTSGTGSDPTFDGGNMASRGDVVVVTINYRLSTLGFLALDDGITNGNFGLADQVTALDWVHAHIRDFGGDPERITIFGQSAGAASVRALLASPRAMGKFQAAISQSNLAGNNYATTYSQYYSIEEEVQIAATPILNETGCANATSQVDCLRAADPFLLVGLPDVARYLVVDGSYLTTPSLELTGTGLAASVPVMMGMMRDDGAAFISYPSPNDTFAEALTADSFSNTSFLAASNAFPVPYHLHPTNASLAVFNATARVASDAEFRCLDHATAYSASLHRVFPRIFFYEFDRSYQLPDYDPNAPVCDAPKTAGRPNGNPEMEYFKCHSGDLYFVFGNLVRMGLPVRDEGDVPFSRFVLDAWTAFARNLDPNPDWAFLAARGYGEAEAVVGRERRWFEVRAEAPTFRNLKWPVSEQLSFGEKEQCNVLGFPLDYYES